MAKLKHTAVKDFAELSLFEEKEENMEKINLREAGAVRAIEDNGVKKFEVLAAPFGSPRRKDKLNQFLSKNTDFMIDIGDRRPLLYLHGFSPRMRKMDRPTSIGSAVVSRIDEEGLWMIAEADNSELSMRTWEAALEGKARASTGSIGYLERHDKVTGEVLTWALAELSIFDIGDRRTPVSDDAVVLPLRALFDEQKIDVPEHFGAGEAQNSGEQSTIRLYKEDKMDELNVKEIVEAALAERETSAKEKEAEREAMRAELIEEIKSEPKYRSTFNINTIDDSEAKKDAVKEENFAYVRALIEDAKMVAAGGAPRMRVLEESESLEIGPMVPTDLHNQIHDILGSYSVIDAAASAGKATIYKTNKLTFSVPTQTSSMTALSDIAEEGAYTANETAFAANNATMQKVGNYMSVAEEALEDQDLFQQWLVRECARAIALSKNADLAALLQAIDGTEVGTSHTITDSEVIQTLYFGLGGEYRKDAIFIMNDATLGYLNAMTLENPRAYGIKGFMPYQMGELGESFLGKPVFTNSNWTSIATAADDEKIIDFVNLNECLYWVERRGLSIFVDPYSTKLSAGTVNFLPSARYGGVVVNSSACNGLDDHS